MKYFHTEPTHSRYTSEETLQDVNSQEYFQRDRQNKTNGSQQKTSTSEDAHESELERMNVEQRLLEEEIWNPSGKNKEVDNGSATKDENVGMTTVFTNAIEQILAGNLQAIAVLTHIIMLIFHMLLITLYFCDISIGKPFDEKKQVTVDTWLTVVLQFFGVAQTTSMLFSAQQLAMRSILMRKTTVTEIHDVVESWAGLGSAIGNIYRQFKTPSTISAPLVAFLYLAGIAGLHITTPALFGVEVFTSNVPVSVMTQGLINWTETNQNLQNEHPDFHEYHYVPVGQGMLSSIREVYGYEPQVSNKSRLLGTSVGLYGGSVYAVPEDNKGTGNISVNATYFGVQCGEAGDAFRVRYDAPRSPTFYVVDAIRDSGNFEWYFSQEHRIYPSERSLQVLPITDVPEKPSNFIYIVSTINILDGHLQKGNTTFSIEPPINYSMAVGWDAIYSAGVVHWQVGEVQVLQCFFKPRQWLLEVDSTTKLVRPGSASTPPSDLDVNNRRFAVTNPQGEYPYRPNQGTAFEDDVDMLIRMFNAAPVLPQPNLTPSYEGSTVVYPFRTVDDHLMQLLDYVPRIDGVFESEADTRTELSLHAVEEALASTAATMYWAELYLSTGTTLVSSRTKREQPVLLQYASKVMMPTQMAQVHLNIIPLAAGFGLAVALVVLLIVLLRHGTLSTNSIHGLGILDVIWMSRRYTEVDWERISDAPVPLTDDLRRRGKGVQVNMLHLLRGEAHRGSSEGTE